MDLFVSLFALGWGMICGYVINEILNNKIGKI